MSLVHNAQIRLPATVIDRVSTAALNAGVILPLAGSFLLPTRTAAADVFVSA
jgi:hypothetical protein